MGMGVLNTLLPTVTGERKGTSNEFILLDSKQTCSDFFYHPIPTILKLFETTELFLRRPLDSLHSGVFLDHQNIMKNGR